MGMMLDHNAKQVRQYTIRHVQLTGSGYLLVLKCTGWDIRATHFPFRICVERVRVLSGAQSYETKPISQLICSTSYFIVLSFDVHVTHKVNRFVTDTKNFI